MMERFRRLGLTEVWKDVEGNVYGERQGTADGPTLILSAHLDTVFPAGTATTVERDGNKLSAPGVGDNSAGLVTILTVLKALQEAAVETHGTIIFMGAVGEEGKGDLRGVKHLFLESELRKRVDLFVSVDGIPTTRMSPIRHWQAVATASRIADRAGTAGVPSGRLIPLSPWPEPSPSLPSSMSHRPLDKATAWVSSGRYLHQLHSQRNMDGDRSTWGERGGPAADGTEVSRFRGPRCRGRKPCAKTDRSG